MWADLLCSGARERRLRIMRPQENQPKSAELAALGAAPV
jgi:hypothetical protein